MTPYNGSNSTVEAKEWLATLIGNAPFGIIALDVAGYCTLINTRAARIFEDSLENIVDSEISDLSQLWPELALAMPNMQSGGRTNFDCDGVSKGEHVYTVSGRIIVSGMLLTFNDVTHETRIQEKQDALLKSLESANKELADFAFICAHDMKSPVSSVIGLIETLEDSDDLLEDTPPVLELMKRSATSLNNTVCSLNKVLSLRQTLGDATECVNISDVIDDALHSLSVDFANTEVALELDIDRDLTVHMQSVHLKSVLQNLLGNAVKYRDTERALKIKVQATQTESQVTLDVIDNGMGFDNNKSGQRVFGLFNRLHTHVEGSGIGLYLTKSIIESYRGRITVQSTKGEGSRFTVVVPDSTGVTRHAA